MPRKVPYQSLAVREQAATEWLSGILESAGYPVVFDTPEREQFWRHMYAQGKGIPRSSLFRMWPDKRTMHAAVVRHAVSSDLYGTQTLETGFSSVVKEYAAIPRTPEWRSSMLRSLGLAMVTGTDHATAVKIEAVVASEADPAEFVEMLSTQKSKYLDLISGRYRWFHLAFVDRAKEGHEDFKQYAGQLAATARGLALNPLAEPPCVDSPELEIFVSLANQYTQPAA